uniref:Ribosome-recycling factor, mitochondrial n=1 Tax=Ascaris lumbricoides TaxID=6252 RepID=A0A9J2PT85_ASCLU
MLKQVSRQTMRIYRSGRRSCCNIDLTGFLCDLNALNASFCASSTPFSFKVEGIHSTPSLWKVRKNEKKVRASKEIHETTTDANNAFVQGALKEMKHLEAILNDELAKHFSMQVDLRTYEEIVVKLDNGEEHKMNRLGRVTLKSPQMVMINFGDNPTAIKAAKLALQKSNLNVNPQQEGVTLYVPVPKMTRERREYLASTAKAKMFNDYKEALNEVYARYNKKSSNELKSQDDAMHTRATLLSIKRTMESRGIELIESRRVELLKEVA